MSSTSSVMRHGGVVMSKFLLPGVALLSLGTFATMFRYDVSTLGATLVVFDRWRGDIAVCRQVASGVPACLPRTSTRHMLDLAEMRRDEAVKRAADEVVRKILEDRATALPAR